MNEIVVLSGKGGTGKSVISAAFASLGDRLVLADCDVDAVNQYLIFNPDHESEEVFVGSSKAVIHQNKCIQCGKCMNHCRFDAISIVHEEFTVNEFNCDGCSLCVHVCPQNAIEMIKNDKSRLFAGSFRFGKMVYGRLAPAEENSGKLVSLVREKAKIIAEVEGVQTIIIDGPPGIGCPVISSMTGADYVVIVAEPSVSSLHDLKRLVYVVSSFNIKVTVIINKYDLNEEVSALIESYCSENMLSVAAKIPFDRAFLDAMLHRKSIVEWMPDSKSVAIIKSVFLNILEEISQKKISDNVH